jgi:hypothetical protein
MLWTLEKFQASEISPLPVFRSLFPLALVQAYDLVWGAQTALAKLSESATVLGTVLVWGRVLALALGVLAQAEVALPAPELVAVEMAPAVFPSPEDGSRSIPRSEWASAPDFPPKRFPPFPDCLRTSLD